jgi:hypothetical protein
MPIATFRKGSRNIGALSQPARAGISLRRAATIWPAPDAHKRKNGPPYIRAGRFVCAACGSRRVDVSPDWRGHRAVGMGRWEWGGDRADTEGMFASVIAEPV